MRRRTPLGLLASFVALVAACGTRVSLGELPPDRTLDGIDPEGDGRFSDDPGAPGDASFDDVVSIHELDAGSSLDAGTDVDAGWSPCGGKACGVSCRVCRPGDVSCFETTELKACSASGACVSAPVTCVDAGSP